MFGLFSPSRNYHLQADSKAEATSWVDLIRREAKVDEEEETMIFGSPVAEMPPVQGLGRSMRGSDERLDRERMASSSPEPENIGPSTTSTGIQVPGIQKSSNQELEYSGNEQASYSDFSDSAPTRLYGGSPVSLSTSVLRTIATANGTTVPTTSPNPKRPVPGRTVSQMSGLKPDDEERVVWHGYLLALKSKGGVRQWKRLWAVLRPKNLAFYKNEEVSDPQFGAITLVLM